MFRKHILLGWANASKEENKNFGDELSVYIIEKLSGRKVYHAPCPCRWKVPLHIVSMLLHFRRIKKETLKSFILFYFSRKYILGIGSILQFYKAGGAVVWGTGIIDRKLTVEKFEFRAVRGKYTRNKLLSLGYAVPEYYGDPAILLPLVYKVEKRPSNKVGIIPHAAHYDTVKNWRLPSEYIIINLRTSNVEKVIDTICSCEMIFSSSLHGLIVANAYGIKAIWCELPTHPLLGDNTKFLDYFSSVKIPEHKPEILSEDLFSDSRELISRAQTNKHLHLPNTGLTELQQKLLEVAPFPVKPIYLPREKPELSAEKDS
ncbi:MAG: polysaccharide pyruvyl transferase family protein [Victivallales bacterium]|nr:polysaccharide pyruvyl transferase family protein [Victivallales bacterium]